MRTNKQVWRDGWKGRSEPVNALAKTVVRRMRENKGRKLLDVGCGNGTDSLFLARHGFAVTATDFSKSGIDALRSEARRKGAAVEAKLHDTAKKFPFPDASFDVIYAHLALHYFDDRTTRRVFSEMRRLLKRGGFFFVKCKSTKDCLYGVGDTVGPDMFRLGHVRHFFTPQYLREMLGDFAILSLRSSTSSYHGKTSGFVQATVRK